MWYEGNLGHAHDGFYMIVGVQKHEVGRSLERRPFKHAQSEGSTASPLGMVPTYISYSTSILVCLEE